MSNTSVTTSGAPLRHNEWAVPPKHIPNSKGEPFKTEAVRFRDPDGATEKINWWHLPDDDRPAHNHPWDFSSDVLQGWLKEVRLTPSATDPGFYEVSIQTHKAGETYEVKANEYHLVIAVGPGTVTRMTCGPASKGNEWGYLTNLRDGAGNPAEIYRRWPDGEAHAFGNSVMGDYVRAQKDPDFMRLLVALNPFLAKRPEAPWNSGRSERRSG